MLLFVEDDTRKLARKALVSRALSRGSPKRDLLNFNAAIVSKFMFVFFFDSHAPVLEKPQRVFDCLILELNFSNMQIEHYKPLELRGFIVLQHVN